MSLVDDDGRKLDLAHHAAQSPRGLKAHDLQLLDPEQQNRRDAREQARHDLLEGDWTRNQLRLVFGDRHEGFSVTNGPGRDVWALLRTQWAKKNPVRLKALAIYYLHIVHGWRQVDLCLAFRHERRYVWALIRRVEELLKDPDSSEGALLLDALDAYNSPPIEILDPQELAA